MFSKGLSPLRTLETPQQSLERQGIVMKIRIHQVQNI